MTTSRRLPADEIATVTVSPFVYNAGSSSITSPLYADSASTTVPLDDSPPALIDQPYHDVQSRSVPVRPSLNQARHDQSNSFSLVTQVHS